MDIQQWPLVDTGGSLWIGARLHSCGLYHVMHHGRTAVLHRGTPTCQLSTKGSSVVALARLSPLPSHPCSYRQEARSLKFLSPRTVCWFKTGRSRSSFSVREVKSSVLTLPGGAQRDECSLLQVGSHRLPLANR
jgi:hypothetical protein